MPRQLKAKSSIIYRGPSMLDGSPIVVVAIVKSSNSKTGDMVQTHILPDVKGLTLSDMNRTGLDAGICGACPHKGTPNNNPKGNATGRTCYVNLGQGPGSVLRKIQGLNPYPDVSADVERIAYIGKGRMVRIGTYGDGAAVPDYVWQSLTRDSIGLTAYTHQGLSNAPYYMVSADSEESAKIAHNAGRRTFRVIPIADAGKPLLSNEILCPSSRGVECKDCGLCDGRKIARSVAIVAHGATAGKFKGA